MITIVHQFNTNMTEADKARLAEAIFHLIEVGQRIKARLTPEELAELERKVKESDCPEFPINEIASTST